ncbi:calmodulin-binding transcription activator 2-like [Dorcoceras hygrometricum]|uniref:Calmodulin-binding transcription activator 2-like n=1 Tax=Dorcoceras hygrometricum TaxID=472368 RepID=A0A2Z7DGR5_9LAMI|nr:calmodulin-binding transcription activator 2-like [Dorcoceras hygrometricum]
MSKIILNLRMRLIPLNELIWCDLILSNRLIRPSNILNKGYLSPYGSRKLTGRRTSCRILLQKIKARTLEMVARTNAVEEHCQLVLNSAWEVVSNTLANIDEWIRFRTELRDQLTSEVDGLEKKIDAFEATISRKLAEIQQNLVVLETTMVRNYTNIQQHVVDEIALVKSQLAEMVDCIKDCMMPKWGKVVQEVKRVKILEVNKEKDQADREKVRVVPRKKDKAMEGEKEAADKKEVNGFEQENAKKT